MINWTWVIVVCACVIAVWDLGRRVTASNAKEVFDSWTAKLVRLNERVDQEIRRASEHAQSNRADATAGIGQLRRELEAGRSEGLASIEVLHSKHKELDRNCAGRVAALELEFAQRARELRSEAAQEYSSLRASLQPAIELAEKLAAATAAIDQHNEAQRQLAIDWQQKFQALVRKWSELETHITSRVAGTLAMAAPPGNHFRNPSG